MTASASIVSFHHLKSGRLRPSHRPFPTLVSRPVQGPPEPSGEETDLLQPEASALTPQRLHTPHSYLAEVTAPHTALLLPHDSSTSAVSFPRLCALPRLADPRPFPQNCKLLDGTPGVYLPPQPPVPTVLPSTHSKGSISSLDRPTKSINLSQTVPKKQKCTVQN